MWFVKNKKPPRELSPTELAAKQQRVLHLVDELNSEIHRLYNSGVHTGLRCGMDFDQKSMIYTDQINSVYFSVHTNIEK